MGMTLHEWKKARVDDATAEVEGLDALARKGSLITVTRSAKGARYYLDGKRIPKAEATEALNAKYQLRSGTRARNRLHDLRRMVRKGEQGITRLDKTTPSHLLVG